MQSRFIKRLLVGPVLLALAATACGGGDGDGGGSDVKSVSIQIGEPQFLTPQNTAETSGAEVLDGLFTGLFDYDPETSEPIPAMAESVESTDSVTWTVKIKDGWTFHNGEDVTAKSYVDAWNFGAHQDNAQQNARFFERIQGYEEVHPDNNPDDDEDVPATAQTMSGLEVVDELTFTVTLNAPFSQFPVMLGYTAYYPMPQVAYEDMDAYNEAPIGNGPFKMKGKWVHNQRIETDRYADYGGDREPNVDEITYVITDDLQTAYTQLLAGEIDTMDALPPAALQTAPRELGDRYIEKESSVIQYIGFPTQYEEFSDPNLRKAISMAIDRETIAQEVFQGTRIPSTGFVSDVVAGARKDICDACVFNPEEAKRLYASTDGLPDNTLEIAYNGDGGHKDWITAVASHLNQNLGINAVPKEFPTFEKMLTDLQEGRHRGPFRMGWAMDYPSPENYLAPIFGTAAIATGSNYGRYSNPEFDNLISQGDQAASLEEGIELYQQAEDRLIQDLPYMPMFFSKTTGGHSENVTNVTIDAFTRVDKFNIDTTE